MYPLIVKYIMMLEASTAFKTVVLPGSIVFVSICPNIFTWTIFCVVFHIPFISSFIRERASAISMLSVFIPIAFILTEIIIWSCTEELYTETMSLWFTLCSSIFCCFRIKINVIFVHINDFTEIHRFVFQLETDERTLVHWINIEHGWMKK